MTRNISACQRAAARGQDAEIKKPAHRVDERAQGEGMVKYEYSCRLVSNIDNVGQGCL
jgi:hypothetical protein